MTIIWKKVGDYIVRKGEISRPARVSSKGLLAGLSAFTTISQDLGNRFPGDPGIGKFYFGGREDTVTWADSETAISNWESRMAPWTGGGVKGKLGIVRVSGNAVIATGFDQISVMQRHYTNRRIPHISFNFPSAWGTVSAAVTKALAFDADWNAWMNGMASQMQTFAPNPVWWTFYPEPEAFNTSTLAAGYRTIQRRMVADLKAHGVKNATFVAGCVQAPFDFGGAGGTNDWRWFYPDWKGTSTNSGGHVGTKDDPNPVDFYLAGDPNSVVDVIGLDLYSQWRAARYPGQESAYPSGKAADPATSYSDFATLWQRMKDRTNFLNKPYALGEYGIEAYHTGAYVPAGVTADVSGVGGAAVFSAANDQKTKDNIYRMFDSVPVDRIVAVEVNNYPRDSHSPWRLEYGDPNRARYEGYGRGMSRIECVRPTFTAPVPIPTSNRPYFGACVLSGGANGVVTKWGPQFPSIRQFFSSTLTVPTIPDGCLMHVSYKASGGTYTDAQIDSFLLSMAGYIVTINHESDNDGLSAAAITARIALMNRFYDRNVAIGRPCLIAPTFTGGLFASYGTDAKRDVWMTTVKGDLLGVDCDGIHDNQTSKPADLVYRKGSGVISYSDEIANAKRYIAKFPQNGWIGVTVPEFGISRASWDTDGAGRAQWIQRNADMFVSEGVFAVQWYDFQDTSTGISDIITSGTAEFSMFKSYVDDNSRYVPFAA